MPRGWGCGGPGSWDCRDEHDASSGEIVRDGGRVGAGRRRRRSDLGVERREHVIVVEGHRARARRSSQLLSAAVEWVLLRRRRGGRSCLRRLEDHDRMQVEC